MWFNSSMVGQSPDLIEDRDMAKRINIERINIEYTKTYATEANAEKAIAKVLGDDHTENGPYLRNIVRYVINPVIVEGKIRYGVLFIGNSAIEAHMHFHFNVVN